MHFGARDAKTLPRAKRNILEHSPLEPSTLAVEALSGKEGPGEGGLAGFLQKPSLAGIFCRSRGGLGILFKNPSPPEKPRAIQSSFLARGGLGFLEKTTS